MSLLLVAAAVVVDETRTTVRFRHVLFRDYAAQVRVGHTLGWVDELVRSAGLVVGLVVVAAPVLRGSKGAAAAGAVLLAGQGAGWGVHHDRAFDGAGNAAAVPVVAVAVVGLIALAWGCAVGARGFTAADGLAVVRWVLLAPALGYLLYALDLVGSFTGPPDGETQVPVSTTFLVVGGALALAGIRWLRPGDRGAGVCVLTGVVAMAAGIAVSPLHVVDDAPPGLLPIGWWAAMSACAAAVVLLVLVPPVRTLAWSGRSAGTPPPRHAAVVGVAVVVLAVGVAVPGLVHAHRPPRFCNESPFGLC